MLKEFIRLFTDEDVAGDFVRIGNEFFLMDNNIKKIILQIKTKPCFAGIYLGCERGRAFAPSLFLLEKLLYLTDKKVCVDFKGEWMFICGKDIFGKSIIRANDCRVGEFVLVENEYCECLGYCKVVADLYSKTKINRQELSSRNKRTTSEIVQKHMSFAMKEKGRVLEHIFDIGDFLRRER